MKIARHAQILKLINQYDIETQEELAARLNESGYKVTQATVSRDIRQLKLMKITREDGHSKYAEQQNTDREVLSKYIRILKESLISMDLAGNLVVIKTVSGMAMAAAAALDELRWGEIAGCIAGDDTIMCAAKSPDDALVVIDKLKKTLESF